MEDTVLPASVVCAACFTVAISAGSSAMGSGRVAGPRPTGGPPGRTQMRSEIQSRDNIVPVMVMLASRTGAARLVAIAFDRQAIERAVAERQ
jgi:hypothetical protein